MSDQRQHSKCSPTQLYSEQHVFSPPSHQALRRDTTGMHPLTSGLEAILRNRGSVSCPFSSRHIKLTYQFSQEVFRMDGSPYLEKEAGPILKGVTRKSKGVTPRKLTRIAIIPKICALLQRIPDAKNY